MVIMPADEQGVDTQQEIQEATASAIHSVFFSFYRHTVLPGLKLLIFMVPVNKRLVIKSNSLTIPATFYQSIRMFGFTGRL